MTPLSKVEAKASSWNKNTSTQSKVCLSNQDRYSNGTWHEPCRSWMCWSKVKKKKKKRQKNVFLYLWNSQTFSSPKTRGDVCYWLGHAAHFAIGLSTPVWYHHWNTRCRNGPFLCNANVSQWSVVIKHVSLPMISSSPTSLSPRCSVLVQSSRNCPVMRKEQLGSEITATFLYTGEPA